jgi:hypothetical protein
MLLRSVLLVIFLLAVCGGSSSSRADQPGFFNTYVATNGNDQNNCLSTSPCASLDTALLKTATGGTVSCLSTPTQNDTLQIFSSVVIDCSSVNYVRTGSVTINLPSSDSLQTVRLRGFTLSGAGLAGLGPLVTINAANTVILEDMKLVQGVKQGVLDTRTSPGTLRITNSAISRNAGVGVVVAGAAGNVAILDNVTSDGNSFGIAVGAGNNVTVSRSVLSGSTFAGVEGDGGAQIIVDNSTIGNNNIGVQSSSSVRISNNNIAFNKTAISGATGTFGNNRFSGNTSMGTAPTPLGGASSDFAQQ